MSGSSFVSPGARSRELLEKTTKRPSAEIEAKALKELLVVPFVLTLAHVVVPVQRSRTKTSSVLFESPGTRFEALLSNATYRPSAEIEGAPLKLFPCVPLELRLTHVVVCADAATHRQ
jgi:hypothetical protein